MDDPDVANINRLLGQSQGAEQPTPSNDPDVSNINNLLSSFRPSSTDDSSWGSFESKAKTLAAQNDFPAQVLLGQAALESGHGTSSFAKDRNNYFGYQAYDSNPDAAKRYATPEQSIMDYINLIKNDPRYAKAWANRDNPTRMLEEIKAAGYATDPGYVDKVMNTPEFRGGYNG